MYMYICYSFIQFLTTSFLGVVVACLHVHLFIIIIIIAIIIINIIIIAIVIIIIK